MEWVGASSLDMRDGGLLNILTRRMVSTAGTKHGTSMPSAGDGGA